jgi:hypothetical protein
MSYGALEALVKSGFHDFDWQGTGITSSAAAAFAQTDGSRSLGVIDNNDWGHGSFGGQDVNLTDILVKYTYIGDANVDGIVGSDDFNQFLLGFNGGGTKVWLNGDFDYDNDVDSEDFNYFLLGFNTYNANGQIILSESFKSDLANFASANGLPLVLPEPSMLLPLGLCSLIARRRRRLQQ